MERLKSFFGSLFAQRTTSSPSSAPDVSTSRQQGSMRSTRKRKPVKLDNDFVDVDSDELEQMMEEEDAAPPTKKQNSRGSKRQKTSASTRPAASKRSEAAEDDEEYQPEAAAEASEDLAGPAKQQGTSAETAADESQDASDQVPEDSSNSDYYSDDDEEYNSSSKGKSKQQGSKKKQKQPKEEKPRKKRLSTRRLCVTYAKQQYRLTDRDLAELTDVEYRDNPHYANGPPMRLYLVRELEELAQRKAERKAREAEDKKERAAARALEARARKAAAAAAAAEKAAAFDARGPKNEKHGSIALPDTCLTRIMTCLAETLEPGGLRGPSAVAKDLAAAALVCWDFYHAAKTGLSALGEATVSLYTHINPRQVDERLEGILTLPGAETLGGWEFWDTAVQRPADLKLPQLKDAARHLGLQVTGTKAELMLRVLSAFKLDGPTTAPAKLLRALLLERRRYCCTLEGPDANRRGAALDQAIQRLYHGGKPLTPAGTTLYQAQASTGAAGVRAAILAEGYKTLDEFMAAADEAYQEWNAKLLAEAEQWRKESQERMARMQAEARQRQEAARMRQQQHNPGGLGMTHFHPVPPAHGMICACGNPAAQYCSKRCCAKCCRAQAGPRCSRHNT